MSKIYTDKWVDKEGVTRYFQDSDATTKLSGIEGGAQVNIIESITVNNQVVTPDENKNVSITIPAAPVQSISKNNTAITPDINGNVNLVIPTGAAADKAVDTSIDTASQSVNLPTSKAVAAFVEGKGYLTQNAVTSVNGQTGAVNITAVSFHVLAAGEDLPAKGVAGGFYFKPNGNGSGTNLYNEWIDTTANGDWECLGPIEVDLSNYVTKTGTEALTNKTINGYTPAAAMAKGVSTTVTNGDSNLVTSGAVYTALSDYAKAPSWVSYTILASGWSGGEYSFEGTYPSSTYDIVDMLFKDTATAEQKEALINAGCGGTYYSTNKLVAEGTVPTVNIPVMLKIVNKG